MACPKASNLALMPSQMAMILLRNSSLFFQRDTNAAVKAATTAMIAQPTGPIAAIADASFPPAPTPSFAWFTKVRTLLPMDAIDFMAPPTPDVSFPTTRSTGPMAAANAAMRRMVFRVPSSICWSFSTNSWTLLTMFRTVGIRASPIWMASSCKADLRIVTCPFRLSCMVAAIFSADPSQLSIALESLFRSASEAFMMARKPDMAFLPTRASAVLAFSDSDSLEKASRQSMMMSLKLLIEPSALVVATVTSPIASPAILMSPVRLVMMERSEVPAWVDLIPALAIRPMARAVSSAEYPSAPAMGATYLKVSPIMDTLVLALEDADANISAKCPESLADKPKAVRASVTISEVVARSSPDAAARLIMPSIPSSISPVFQPAMAMYSKAAPASEAENLVFAPISRALSRRSSNSSPVAPEMA